MKCIIIHGSQSDMHVLRETRVAGQNPENQIQRILDPEVPFERKLHSL